MKNSNKLFIGAGLVSILTGIIAYGYKPDMLTRISTNKDNKKALSVLLIIGGLISLLFAVDDLFLPEDEEEELVEE